MNGLNLDQANQIVVNIWRVCSECKAKMDPRSTLCPNPKCRAITEFNRVIVGSYYEHYELKKCEIHDTQITYCIHPTENSELKDLRTYCTQCLKDELKESGK